MSDSADFMENAFENLGSEEFAESSNESELDANESISEQDDSNSEASSTPAIEDEPELDLKTQLANLRNEIAMLRANKEQEVPASPAVPAPIPFFESEDEHTSFVSGQEPANTVMNKIYNAIEQRLMQNVEPQMMQTAIRVYSQEMFRREFYEANKDLKPYEPIVKEVALELARTNPNLDISEAFAKVADIARKRAGLENKSNSNQRQPIRNPGFGGAGASRASGSSGSSQQQQKSIQDAIAELIG